MQTLNILDRTYTYRNIEFLLRVYLRDIPNLIKL